MRRLVGVALLSLACQQDGFAQELPAFAYTTEVPVWCITLPGGVAPPFPDAPANAAGGVVRVRMRFADASSPPQVEVFTNTGGPEFATAVGAHVATYRFHCLRSLRPTTTVNQEFQFVARNMRAVIAGPARFYRRLPPCTVTYPDPPEYPRNWSGSASLDRVPDAGSALVGLRFGANESAPAVRILYDGGSRHFSRTAEKHASGIRMRCEGDDAYPAVAVVPYKFKTEGVAVATPLPVPLTDFLAVVEQPDSMKVFFDFNTMGCPFQFSLVPLRPEDSNVVSMDPAVPEDRIEFRSWLGKVRLKLPQKLLNDLRGNALKVQVPCVVMNFL